MFTEKEVIKNIIKIRNNHGLTKREEIGRAHV